MQTHDRRLAPTAAFALALAAALPARAAGPADLYYERAVMVAADARCRLFAPDLAAALASSAEQARSAALRAGAAPDGLDAVRSRAWSRAGAVPCASRDVQTAADRVRAAFASYSRVTRQTFPGEAGGWLAVRSVSPNATVWRLSEAGSANGDPVLLGLVGRAGPSALVAVAGFRDLARPFTARLVLRDPSRAPGAFLNGLQSHALLPPLPARMPPRYATRSVIAEARTDADPLISPRGARSPVAFRFPHAAAEALSALDPREAVAVEFDVSGPRGQETRTAYFEVGDFAAGRAFLTADQR